MTSPRTTIDRAGSRSEAVGPSHLMTTRRERDPAGTPGASSRRSVATNRPSLGPPSDFGDIETQRIITIFGSNTRAGYWEPPERLEVLTLFGGATLDFRDANLYSGDTHVNCLAMFGGIEIIVPADIEVDANGTGLFGGFDHKPLKRRGLLRRFMEPDDPSDSDFDPDDDPPRLVIRGFAMFGGVSVRVK